MGRRIEEELRAAYRSEILKVRPLAPLNWYDARPVFDVWNLQSLANEEERVWQRGETKPELSRIGYKWS